MGLLLNIVSALPKWCHHCLDVTGTKKMKNGKGQTPTYYCTRCGKNK